MSPSALLLAVSSFWVGSEIVIMWRKKSKAAESTSRDRYSIVVIWILFALGPALGSMASSIRATRMSAALQPYAFFGGLSLILIGIAIRWVAIATLARYFTVDVAISNDHKVIDRGLYGIVRHPSYAGTLLSMFGLGLALVNWTSFAIVFICAIAALGYRIAVEERALTEALGDDYRAYAARTKRLIPGVF